VPTIQSRDRIWTRIGFVKHEKYDTQIDAIVENEECGDQCDDVPRTGAELPRFESLVSTAVVSYGVLSLVSFLHSCSESCVNAHDLSRAHSYLSSPIVEKNNEARNLNFLKASIQENRVDKRHSDWPR
jgi:hypothetical protein